MALVTINSQLSTLQFAVAQGAGRVAVDPYWLPITIIAYDTLAKQTPPGLMPTVDTTGSGMEKYARKIGTTDLNGMLRQFGATIDLPSGGAPTLLTAALWDYLGPGGAVTVFGLDPFASVTAPDGRQFAYCYWDGLMRAAKLGEVARSEGAYSLTLDFYRMTRRVV